MQNAFIHRSISLGLAAVLTLAMLGGIDQLSQQPQAASLWAQQTAVRA